MKETIDSLKENWKDIIESVPEDSKRTPAVAILRSAGVKPVALEDDTVVLAFRHPIHKEQMEKIENQRVTEKIIGNFLGHPCHVRCINDIEWMRKKERHPPFHNPKEWALEHSKEIIEYYIDNDCLKESTAKHFGITTWSLMYVLVKEGLNDEVYSSFLIKKGVGANPKSLKGREYKATNLLTPWALGQSGNIAGRPLLTSKNLVLAAEQVDEACKALPIAILAFIKDTREQQRTWAEEKARIDAQSLNTAYAWKEKNEILEKKMVLMTNELVKVKTDLQLQIEQKLELQKDKEALIKENLRLQRKIASAQGTLSQKIQNILVSGGEDSLTGRDVK